MAIVRSYSLFLSALPAIVMTAIILPYLYSFVLSGAKGDNSFFVAFGTLCTSGAFPKVFIRPRCSLIPPCTAMGITFALLPHRLKVQKSEAMANVT